LKFRFPLLSRVNSERLRCRIPYHSISTGVTTIAEHSNTNLAWSAARVRQLRRWRMLLGLGGLLLTASFFLPEVQPTGLFPPIPFLSEPEPPTIPFSEVCDLFKDCYNSAALPSVDDILGTCIWYILTHVFGLMCFLVWIKSRDYRLCNQSRLGSSLRWIITLATSFIVICFALNEASNSRASGYVEEIVIGVLVAAIIILCWRSLRTDPGGRLFAVWFLGLLFFASHLFTLFARPLYGIWVTRAGTLLIVIAAYAEVVIRCRTGLLASLGRLLICNVRLPDLSGPNCFECGYLLEYLTSNRCPECGLAFDPADHDFDETPENKRTAILNKVT